MWDGYGDYALPSSVLRTPRVVVENREYYLLEVSLPNFVSGAVEDAWEAGTAFPMQPPAFIWPAAQTWCITSDVDPHWAGIGAEPTLIDSLRSEPRLDVVLVEADQKLPFYY